MYFYLNEYSLYGQFESITDFVSGELKDIVGCIQIISDSNNVILAKVSDLYKAKITKKHCFSDLSSLIVNGEDEKLRLRLALELIYDTREWDNDGVVQNLEKTYFWKENDVSATSMAEAAARSGALLSFTRTGMVDDFIEITSESNCFKVISVHHDYFLVDKFATTIKISREKILKIKYSGSRLNFSQLEKSYGPDTLEKKEFSVLLKTLDKFADHESFQTIAIDDGLEYKKYSPDQEDKDEFKSKRYKNKTIMKFRYSRKQRVFGYRVNDIFYVLRLERDHKISDYG